jgi:hypothetical protein
MHDNPQELGLRKGSNKLGTAAAEVRLDSKPEKSWCGNCGSSRMEEQIQRGAGYRILPCLALPCLVSSLPLLCFVLPYVVLLALGQGAEAVHGLNMICSNLKRCTQLFNTLDCIERGRCTSYFSFSHFFKTSSCRIFLSFF